MEIEAQRDECEYSSVEPSPRCPECNSLRIFRDGVRKTRDGKVQRYLCRECGFRFSDPSAKHREDLGIIMEAAPPHFEESQHHENDTRLDFEEDIDSLPLDEEEAPKECDGSHPDHINLNGHFSNRRVCAEAKNLAATETTGNVVAGEISETKSLLLRFALHMKKQGRAESTMLTRGRQMAVLAKRGANLLDPESIKEAIANQPWANKRKETAVDAYTNFLDMLGRTWNPPRYRVEEKIPFIPTEEEIDTLINETGPKISTFLQLLKETAVRAGEANQLKWTDIDFERNVVRITPEKGSRPRIFNMSPKLVNKLAALKRRKDTPDPNRIFSKLIKTTRRLYLRKRNRLAKFYENPRLLQIHFHTFRHWKATTLYHETKDLLYVQRFLGHRNINNTMLYIQIEETLFNSGPEQYICKVATTVEEAIPLLEQGFTEASDFNGVKIYRKRA